MPPELTGEMDIAKNRSPDTSQSKGGGSVAKASSRAKQRFQDSKVAKAAFEQSGAVEELPPSASSASTAMPPSQSAIAVADGMTGVNGARGPLPPDWPDERGFIPPPPTPTRPACCPTDGPVMTHTKIYHGNDGEFTEALASYYHFRDDARFGGWQNYLERSDDFIRFCCHMHIAEMLSARGGASETRVVWSWPDSR
jgi:hypothetical protein